MQPMKICTIYISNKIKDINTYFYQKTLLRSIKISGKEDMYLPKVII